MDSLRRSSFALLFFLLFSSCVSSSAAKFNIPRLRTRPRTIQNEPILMSASESKDYKTFLYTQPLDHFNYRPDSYKTFQQRYLINFKYWDGANTSAPIFVLFGGEESIDYDRDINGFLPENAPHFKALLVYIEHRYYGKSVPFGTKEEAMKNASTLGYCNSAQAIADYAAVLLHIKQKYSAEKCPVIVIGGSYGGMLASWFRLKYPHIALGALASSSPILYFDGVVDPQVGYYTIVTKDFKDYLDSLYTDAAQYDEPPKYPVSRVCGAIDGAEGTDTLDKIFAAVVTYMGNTSCYDMEEFGSPTSTYDMFTWQVCTELVFPIGHGHNDTMFPLAPFDLSSFSKTCEGLFGVQPKPHWVTTYYGGQDIKLILHNFASNIIFSNGLRDPYSSGGVLKNISDSVVALNTVNGSHCLDILPAKESDPLWLIMQRKAEVEIIEGWLAKYHADLLEFEDETRARSQELE
ncbi:prolylcarboxypeptidase-like protein [Citrus sinensis]|uniref:Prolylcarboxypeptidase-like protein n=1 Tax=Citrus sinensis TaxID=2711 RepID=A0ACB8IT01_CITSI|nr:prolylcarboxypeptidase-like protein [Citrus sinensis]